MKQKHFIDSHKGATSIFCLALMAYYSQWDNTTAWVYLALHGTYGLLWVLKSFTFPDKQWEQETGIGYGLVIWGGLSLYWIAPWLICSKGLEAPPWMLALCVFLFGLGVFWHFASDMQKHVTLTHKPGLFFDGLWAKSRNPNYFGELLIYLSFVLMPFVDVNGGIGWERWLPIAALVAFVSLVWVPNMKRKDRSLSRYPEFADYKARSGWIFPKP